ncbi:hypothetical protein LOZ53_006254 [Ophidiomyces ophidiicola]|nr:hypothetical protein LOZ54_005940 [Ophidiomyces ophidiicola]KAI1981580.1 hypothetical protein LOZ55_000602 [Ophidiomyces ophidiicola]KAI1982580.1 hypothetical protein LOZ53_006254 [Ophidiomyces ophidiicola]KAI1998706.1 hypothetical protein LOZ51_002440 [Ophidiomyces ophidiicola]
MKRLLSKLKRAFRPGKPRPLPPLAFQPTTDTSLSIAHEPSRLERLPPELRRMILSFMSLRDLSTMNLVCRTFYEQYKLDRTFLLRHCLENTLENVTVDACSAYWSGKLELHCGISLEKTSGFFESYRNRLSASQQSLIFPEKLSERVLKDMIRFHYMVWNTAKLYATTTMANLAVEINEPQSVSSSNTEETRIVRALYRFQVCCNIFGKGYERWRASDFRSIESINISVMYFDLFEPWEVEEIACIHHFITQQFNQIFDAISWDVNEKNPKFANERPPTPPGAFHLEDECTRQDLLEGVISWGLEFLDIALSIKNHDHLVTVMQDNITYVWGYFLGFFGPFSESAQDNLRDNHLTFRHEKQDRAEPLPFQGDDASLPPYAWTVIWSGTYSNYYGYCIRSSFRDWGYIFWDKHRLAHPSLIEAFESQNSYYDPREEHWYHLF